MRASCRRATSAAGGRWPGPPCPCGAGRYGAARIGVDVPGAQLVYRGLLAVGEAQHVARPAARPLAARQDVLEDVEEVPRAAHGLELLPRDCESHDSLTSADRERNLDR